MQITRRHLLTAAGGLAATAALAACGSNNGLSNNSGSSSAGSSGGSKPTLAQWYHQYGEAGTKEAVNKYAASYPDATVNVTWYAGNYDTAVPAALLTNSFPDVFEYGNGPTLDMIKGGQVVDMTDVLGSSVSKFNQSVIKRLTFEGKIWAVPQVIDMQLLYYRPSLLKKAGVQPPTTFAALVDAARAQTTKDMGGFFAGNDGGVGVLGNMFVWASGFEQLNSGRTGLGFLEPNFYDSLKAYQAFYKSNALLKSASKDWFDASPFINGETAMQWGGLWSMPDVQKAFGNDFGVLAFPAMGSSGRPAVPFGAYSSCVAAKSKNVDAAKAFVKWLWVDQTADQVDFANSYGTHIPSQVALVPQCTKIAQGPGKDAADMVAKEGFASDIMWTGPIGDAFNSAMTNVIVKGADPASEFKPVGDKAVSELKRING
ncbi:MAG TPA: extracellular solute-binding protein [Propionibacteriaceae bacterium]|nr:extracellular solute-binding protein [Propionibacteriaceae bacterium]